jgi:hypothetical protein
MSAPQAYRSSHKVAIELPGIVLAFRRAPNSRLTTWYMGRTVSASPRLWMGSYTTPPSSPTEIGT